MSVAVILVLLAPLAGAMLAPAFGEFPSQRRVVVIACAAALAAGAALALVRTISGSGVVWRGFTLDPWRALLVSGAVLSAALAVAKGDHAERPPIAQAAIFAATAALIAPLLVAEAHTLAVALPIGTAGLAVAAFAVTDEGSGTLRAVRSLVALGASDVLVLIALGMSIANGTRLPAELSAASSVLFLIAALPRLGLVPFAYALDDAIEADRGLGLLWNGAARAQGFLLLLMATGAHRGVAYAAASAAALSLIVAGIRAFGRPPSAIEGASLATVGTAVAVIGFSVGGPTASWGAILATVAAFAAWPAWSAGTAWGSVARASLSAIPAGGLLTGATLVVAATLDAGTARPWFLALAVAAIAGLLVAAVAAWATDDAPMLGEPVSSHAAAGLGILAALALAAVPARAASGLAGPITRTLGTGGLLSVVDPPGIPEDLAVLALATAIVAFVVGPGRAGSGGAVRRQSASPARVPISWWAAAAPAPNPGSSLARARAEHLARRWIVAYAFLFAAAVGLAVRVYVVASGRGFL